MKPCQAFLAVTLLALAGCTSVAPVAIPAPSVPSGSGPAGGIDAPGLTTSPPQYPASWILPDRNLTPGALQPGVTLKDLCPHVSPALEAQRPSAGAKRVVYAQYGIVHHAPGAYEIDHLVPVELGGLVPAPATRVAENLWPEENIPTSPALMAKYRVDPAYAHNPKDLLEDVLHKDVCAGTVSLSTAQRAIVADWRSAFVKYVGQP